VKFVGVDELHAAFSMKAAHAAIAWCRVQDIRVKPIFGLEWVSESQSCALNENKNSREQNSIRISYK
jgi:hypothetical protein